MSGVGDTWSGEDWQRYCRQLLGLRFGVSFQPVPDRDRGDFGIDGFTSNGEVFQFYAAQDPLSPADLYSKQRAKITADLNKLEENLAKVLELTDIARVGCWVLLVPRCDTKRILDHGSTKAKELRYKGLVGLDDQFYVRVLTPEDFGIERRRLAGEGVALLPKPPPEVTEESAKAWEARRPDAVAALSAKVARLPSITSRQDRDELCMELIRCYLRGADLREQIRSAQPQMWEYINNAREHRERTLRLETLAASPHERLTLREEVRELASRLQSEPMRLGSGLAEDLTWGIVADWLIRCPLDPLPQAVS